MSDEKEKLHFDRCYNPFKMDRHLRKKSLRKPSLAAKKMFPHLTNSHYLCGMCRRKVELISNKNCLKVATSSEDVEEEIISVTVSTSSAGSNFVANNIYNFIEESMEDPDCQISLPTSLIIDSVQLLNYMKLVYHDDSCSRNKRFKILSLLPKDCSYKLIKQHFDTNNKTIRKSKDMVKENGVLSSPICKRGNSLHEDVITLVTQFYDRDDVSYTMPGMKNAISVQTNAGKKQKIQKQLLLLNLKEAFSLFKSEYPDIRIGFSKFASLRPKQFVLAGSSGTHSICVCPYHQNLKLMIMDSNLQKLTENEDFPLSSYKDCIKMIVCETPNEKCFLMKCSLCPGKEELRNLLERIFDEDSEKISFKQWVLQPRATLETIIKDPMEFVDCLCDKVQEILPHAYIATKQSEFNRQLKEKLKPGEFLILADFAENYAFTVQNAAPGFHWNNDQATIYNLVIYYRSNEETKHCSLVIISDCLNHDATSVYAYHEIAINYLKTKFTAIEKIFYFTDGAPQQYKNYKNVINLAHHFGDYGITAEWHFFPTAHGKGPCDGLGACVKRSAVRASLQSTNTILSAEELFKWLVHTARLPNIDFEYFDSKYYNVMKRRLNKRFSTNNRIKALQQKHALVPIENGYIRAKTFSESSVHEDFKIL